MTDQPQGPWTLGHAAVNGVRLHYAEAGSGPLVVLLHGFPEFWYCWRHQIPALASAGFRVVAPDLRGYNLSDKPTGVPSYRVPLLVEDVAGLIRHAGAERAVVVGHDWGGAIAWKFAQDHPELVERLVILNAPHPAAFGRELRTPRQFFRSTYILLFQLPWLPEWLFRRNDFAALDVLFRKEPVRHGAFTDAEVRHYKQALAVPGALTAALNYYRAALRYPQRSDDERPIAAPTLVIWGMRDRYLGVGLTQGLERWVQNLRVVRLPHASHWVQNDAAEEVNRLMVGFVRERGSR